MKLYPYQEDFIERAKEVLYTKYLALVIAEYRTGKTFMAIHIAEEYGRVLVLTKKAAIPSWEKDLAQTGYNNFTITNYEQAHKFNGSDYDIFILDESHSRLSAYPKMSKTAKIVQKLTVNKRIIFLTATPQAESGSQWFHQLKMSTWSPFRNYTNFYRWFDAFGVPQTIYLHNRKVNTYKKARENKIMKILEPYLLTLSQAEAGFDVKVNIKKHYVQNQPLLDFCKKFEKMKVAQIRDIIVTAETPATLMQRLHQFCGGVAYGLDDKEMILSSYKAEYINDNFYGHTKVVVLCNYVLEREILLDYLPKSTDNIDDFRHGAYKYFIGNIKRYSEGVDFSYAETMIIYSLNFSATTFLQSQQRLCNKLRKRPVTVHYLLMKGGIDEYVMQAVEDKKNFTSKFYKGNK